MPSKLKTIVLLRGTSKYDDQLRKLADRVASGRMAHDPMKWITILEGIERRGATILRRNNVVDLAIRLLGELYDIDLPRRTAPVGTNRHTRHRAVLGRSPVPSPLAGEG